MPRKSTPEVAVIEDSIAKVWAKALSSVLVMAPPWIIGTGAVALTHAFHGRWHGNVWAAVGLLPPTALLTALAWKFSHHRTWLNRVHVTATTAAAGVWTAYATEFGPLHGPLMSYSTIVGGITLALSWNYRLAIRADGEGRGGDTLRELFGEKAETVGLAGSRMHTIKTAAHKVIAKLHLVPGEKVADDVQKKAGHIEAALQLPPGSVTTSPDLDRADRVDVTVSDPRTMRQPIPWPGPSRPGKSIAEPLRPGVFQDLEEVDLVVVGTHLQVMGKSGAGKSIGCAWNTLAEIVSRPDAAVFAIDLVKGEQTIGAFRTALHRFETSLEGAQELLNDMAAELPHRTNILAAGGHTKWVRGCGIAYWVLWIEEAWKLFDKINMEAFEDLMKAVRSAGGTVVFSLQRSDHSQVPTIVRGQSSFWCFGVQVAKDAAFGLSEEQSEAGARPELWSHNYPGMSVIDAPSIPRDRIAMAVRTFDWADDMAAVRAHADQYPASRKASDAITAKLSRFSEPPGDPAQPPAPETAPVADEDVELLLQAAEMVVSTQHVSMAMLQRKLRVGHEKAGYLMELLEHARVIGASGADGSRDILIPADDLPELLERLRARDPEPTGGDDVMAEYVRTPDPDPELTAQVDADDPIKDDPTDRPFAFARKDGEKMPAEDAARLVTDQIAAWHAEGRREFATRDLRPVWEASGYSRPWIISRVKELIAAGVLADGENGGYEIVRAPAAL